MKCLNYILDERGEQPVPEPDFIRWTMWLGTHPTLRKVACELLLGGRAEVSTIFLGLDMGWGRKAPVLWETMVFSTDARGEGEVNILAENRCSGTREQALAMHAEMVAKFQATPVAAP